MLSKLAMNFFCAIPKGTPINADGINSFASFGPYYVASRQVGRQIITKTNPNYKGSRPHNIDTFVFTRTPTSTRACCRSRPARPTTTPVVFRRRRTRISPQQFGVNKGRYFVNRGLNVDYIAMNTTRPAFSNVDHAQGRELRGRPAGAGPGPRQVRGLPQRPDPAAGPRRLQGHQGLPDQGLRLREGARRCRRRPAAARTSRCTRGNTRGRPAAGPGVQVQPEPDRLQREREALPGLPDLHRRRHEG